MPHGNPKPRHNANALCKSNRFPGFGDIWLIGEQKGNQLTAEAGKTGILCLEQNPLYLYLYFLILFLPKETRFCSALFPLGKKMVRSQVLVLMVCCCYEKQKEVHFKAPGRSKYYLKSQVLQLPAESVDVMSFSKVPTEFDMVAQGKCHLKNGKTGIFNKE